MGFLNGFAKPKTSTPVSAGHYSPEDAPEEVTRLVAEFVAGEGFVEVR